MMSAVKGLVVDVITSRFGRAFFRPLMRDRVVIFMLHRFADPARAIRGHDPAIVREAIETLRQARVPILSLRSLVEGLAREEPMEGVVFTVDDGYDDFDTVGAPMFREHDVPVTVFLATDFMDRREWFWWDKLEHALAVSSAAPDRRPCPESTIGEIKRLPEADRLPAVERLVAELGVSLPGQPPPEFSPMSWDRVRSLEASGIDFGPHSVSHPSLARVGEERLAKEIRDSRARLQAELSDPIDVFCYPFGLDEDVSDAACEAVRAAGLAGSVVATGGFVSTRDGRAIDVFRLPRFPFPSAHADLEQVVFGFERFKDLVRAGPRG